MPVLSVSVSVDNTNPSLNTAVTFSANMTAGPEGKIPTYDWQLNFGSWFSLGTSATFSYHSEFADTIEVRVTVSYSGGKTATSDPVTVTWTNAGS